MHYFPTAWMDLEDIMLIKISQTKKEKYQIVLLIWNLKNSKQMNKQTEQKQPHRNRPKG